MTIPSLRQYQALSQSQKTSGFRAQISTLWADSCSDFRPDPAIADCEMKQNKISIGEENKTLVTFTDTTSTDMH